MPGRPHLIARAGAALLTLLVCAGCAVSVDDPDPVPADRAVCGEIISALPTTVLDQDRRTVRPGRLSVAWGNPPIILRCGVPQPAALTEASECIEVNDVGWFDEGAQGGRIYTTIGRQVFVEVSVPTAYAPEVNGLVDVAAAISAHDPQLKACG